MMLQNTSNESVLVRQTAQEAVVEHLRTQILSRQLAPGERLVQNEIAEQLGVSRTPIREALHRLAHEGLVVLSSYKGASVAEFSRLDLVEIYTIRTALESHAAHLAAQHITPEEIDGLETLLDQMKSAFEAQDLTLLTEAHHQFHAALYAASRRPRLYELTIQYLSLADVYQRMALTLGRAARDPIIEHVEIMAALRERDADRVAHLTRMHLRITAAELAELFPEEEKGGTDSA